MFTGLTAAAHGVVETVVTHTSTDVPRSQIHRHVKMTLVGVTVTVAFLEKEESVNLDIGGVHLYVLYELYGYGYS